MGVAPEDSLVLLLYMFIIIVTAYIWYFLEPFIEICKGYYGSKKYQNFGIVNLRRILK